MPNLTVVAHVHAQAGKEDALREALLTLVEPTRREQGCVQYDLHLATPHFQAVLPRVQALCSRPPETYTRIA